MRSSFLEEAGGVGGVKGVRILPEEDLVVPLVGVSGGSHMSFKSARDDLVETVDAGDNHENLFGSTTDSISWLLFFEIGVGRKVVQDF